jgi:3-deoxy-manno-octulosonate cytidylyltransferase (CMP-KDO synthetase)
MPNKSEMQRIVVIPARMGSSRFPGKPLANIAGKSMLAWVVENAVLAVGQNNTFVATCDEEIMSEALQLGVQGVKTSPLHERATDRTAEAVSILESVGAKLSSVVMLQGDEPTIRADSILAVLNRLEADPSVEIVNLAGPVSSLGEWGDPNCIKVVARSDGTALYFSRLPIPHITGVEFSLAVKQVCAIGFNLPALRTFAGMIPTALEESESIDMLRWLENGGKVHLEPIHYITHAVDVEQDIARVEEILQNIEN